MSPSKAHPRHGTDSARQSLVRAQLLLEEALQLIDAHGAVTDLGARLQEVIEALKARTG